jgi:hypothetical protein
MFNQEELTQDSIHVETEGKDKFHQQESFHQSRTISTVKNDQNVIAKQYHKYKKISYSLI